MGLVKCTAFVSQGAYRAEPGDVIDTSNILYTLYPSSFSAEDVELDTLVAGAPTSAYTQTYSTADKTVAAPTAETLTDSTTGTASNTLAAGVGKETIEIPVNLATVADGDVLTDLVIPYKFKITAFDVYVTNEVTTASKATTLGLEIGATPVTGGAVALTSANAATLGAKVAGSAITAANTGAAAGVVSIVASSTTAFAEGQVVAVISIQNMDTADAFASLVDEQAKAAADDLDNRKTITAIIDDLQTLGLVG